MYGEPKPAPLLPLGPSLVDEFGGPSVDELADLPAGVFADVLNQQTPDQFTAPLLKLDELFLTRYGHPHLPTCYRAYPTLTQKLSRALAMVESKSAKPSPSAAALGFSAPPSCASARKPAAAERTPALRAGVGGTADAFEAFRMRGSSRYHRIGRECESAQPVCYICQQKGHLAKECKGQH